MFWILYLVDHLFLFHYFFRGFLLLSIENSYSAFSFCIAFSVFMNLGKTVTCCSLERVFVCESLCIQTVCAQCLWLESCIWCGYKSHLSSVCGSKELVSKYLNNPYSSVSKRKQTTLSKKWKTCIDIFPKETYRWPTGTWKNTQHRWLLEKWKSKQ